MLAVSRCTPTRKVPVPASSRARNSEICAMVIGSPLFTMFLGSETGRIYIKNETLPPAAAKSRHFITSRIVRSY